MIIKKVLIQAESPGKRATRILYCVSAPLDGLVIALVHPGPR